MLLALSLLCWLVVVACSLWFFRFASVFIQLLKATARRVTLGQEVSVHGPDPVLNSFISGLKYELTANAVLLLAGAEGLLVQFDVGGAGEFGLIALTLLNVAFSLRTRALILKFGCWQAKRALLQYQENPGEKSFSNAEEVTKSTLRSCMVQHFQGLLPAALPALLLALAVCCRYLRKDEYPLEDFSCPVQDKLLLLMSQAGRCRPEAPSYFRGRSLFPSGILWEIFTYLLYQFYLTKFTLQSGFIISMRTSISL